VQLLSHQCTWRKSSHPEDVIDAAEVKQRVIVIIDIVMLYRLLVFSFFL
jgi:hypothetical protein